jgi:flagellar hook-length control protein FliK
MHIIGEIAEKAALELRQGHTEVRLELDPPDLGRVLVRLTSERGVVAARLEVTLPAVKDLLQENLGNLRTALEKAQVGIGDCTVSLGTARQHQEFAPSDHRRQAPAPLSRPLPLASQSPLPSARIFAASPAPSAAALDYLA